MRLAHVPSSLPGATDRLLAGVADRLRAAGLRPCGVVQRAPGTAGGGRCPMILTLLPDGPDLRISQDRGAMARGCHLDAGALETAVAEVRRRLGSGPDLLLLNKFGKHEAMGRGFRPVIAEALDLGLPVILGVGPANLEAYESFAGGLSHPLPADATAILDWLTGTMTGRSPGPGAGPALPVPPQNGQAAE